MHRIPHEIVQGEHPVRLYADSSQHCNDSVLELVERIVKMINGSGVKVELLLEVAQRLLEDFLLLIDDIIFQSSNENFEVQLEGKRKLKSRKAHVLNTYDRQHDFLRSIVLNLLHPNGANLLLILSQHLRQCLATLRILLE